MTDIVSSFSKPTAPVTWPAPAVWPAPGAAQVVSVRTKVQTAAWAKPARPPSAAVVAIKNYLSSPPISSDV